ncbi:class I SAM-dependent methyltransferase [Candidatus Riflebacteria bacterium]
MKNPKKKSIKSKSWNWEENITEFWKNPADEIYPLLYKWKANGFNSLLDLCCGIGRHAILFAENGFDVCAYDLSKTGTEILDKYAKQKKLNIKIDTGDMLNLPYRDSSFDCLIAFHSIYHTDYKGLKKVIKEIHRVTKTNAEIFVTFNSKENPAYKNPANTIIDNYTIIRNEEPEIGIPHTFLDYDDVLNLLKNKKIIQIQQIENYFADRKSKHFFVKYKNQ